MNLQSFLVKNLDHINPRNFSRLYSKYLDTNAYDGVRRVSSEEAFELARAIGGAEGFLVGISSAAAIYAAIEVAKELGSGKKVLALAPDNGERYLSTTLYDFDQE